VHEGDAQAAAGDADRDGAARIEALTVARGRVEQLAQLRGDRGGLAGRPVGPQGRRGALQLVAAGGRFGPALEQALQEGQVLGAGDVGDQPVVLGVGGMPW
jgi:hypothetical protein